jgi:hypothetical protein
VSKRDELTLMPSKLSIRRNHIRGFSNDLVRRFALLDHNKVAPWLTVNRLLPVA